MMTKNNRCPNVHAVSRLGLPLNMFTMGFNAGGGRGVNPGFLLSSGDLTSQGKETEPMKVMIEKTMSDMLPILPIVDKVSLADSLLSAGAS